MRVAVGTLTSAVTAGLPTGRPAADVARGSSRVSWAIDSPAPGRPTVAARDRRIA